MTFDLVWWRSETEEELIILGKKENVSCRNAIFGAWDMVVKCKYRINAASLSPLGIPQWEAGRYMQIISKLPRPTVNQVVRNGNELKIETFGSYR